MPMLISVCAKAYVIWSYYPIAFIILDFSPFYFSAFCFLCVGGSRLANFYHSAANAFCIQNLNTYLLTDADAQTMISNAGGGTKGWTKVSATLSSLVSIPLALVLCPFTLLWTHSNALTSRLTISEYSAPPSLHLVKHTVSYPTAAPILALSNATPHISNPLPVHPVPFLHIGGRQRSSIPSPN
jgi:hypothetical protein